jgi:hypothetical protein
MTTKQTLNVEAIKLIKDWGVWMVAVQTAVITFLGEYWCPSGKDSFICSARHDMLLRGINPCGGMGT